MFCLRLHKRPKELLLGQRAVPNLRIVISRLHESFEARAISAFVWRARDHDPQTPLFRLSHLFLSHEVRPYLLLEPLHLRRDVQSLRIQVGCAIRSGDAVCVAIRASAHVRAQLVVRLVLERQRNLALGPKHATLGDAQQSWRWRRRHMDVAAERLHFYFPVKRRRALRFAMVLACGVWIVTTCSCAPPLAAAAPLNDAVA
mmetsp:Transcript_2484/g.6205  ORF Transcript_2484/g.6205 Transcript_2484/m.6205 type:complete len:201 (-) Transcript_2484:1675-2277(-)